MSYLLSENGLMSEFKTAEDLTKDLSVGAYLVQEDDGDNFIFIVGAHGWPVCRFFVESSGYISDCYTNDSTDRMFKLMRELDFI